MIDSISTAEAVARLERVAPEIEAEIFPDCGHDLSLVQADRFNGPVLEFLDSGQPTSPLGSQARSKIVVRRLNSLDHDLY